MIKKSPFGKLYIGKCYKRKFSSKAAAKKFIKANKSRNATPKHVYQCDKCRGWHLSRKSHSEYLQTVADYKLIAFLENDLGVVSGGS